MQKKLSFTKAVCFLLLIISSLSSIAQSKDERKIKELFQKELDCWNSGDIDCYVALYAPHDSTRMLLGNRDIFGRDSIKAFYKKYWPKERMGKLSFENVKIEMLSKKYSYVSGNFIVNFPGTDRKTVSGRFSGLMRKMNGKWYLYTDHSG